VPVTLRNGIDRRITMPNWCSNNISIVGNTDTIKQLWEDATSTNEENTERGLLDAMVPMPEELNGTTAPGDAPNWYSWRVENWGTKWDVSTEGLEFIDHGDGTAVIQGWFDSAWSPPIGAYEKFTDAMEGIDVEASYYECGMDYAGFWNAWDGDQCLENLREQYELPHHERGELYDLYMRLDDEWNLSENFEMWDDEEVES